MSVWNRLLSPSKNGNKTLLAPEKPKHTFSVSLCICSYETVEVKTLSFVEAMQGCPDPKIRRKTVYGDALIARSRGRAAYNFINETLDDILLFVDDDISGNTMEATTMLWDMYSNDLDIVGAAYPLKTTDNPNLAFRPLEAGTFVFGEKGGIVPVRYLSTGFMAIRRKVLQEMVDQQIMPTCRVGQVRYYPFFNPWPYHIADKEWFVPGKSDPKKEWNDLSEDWVFCQRAMDLGFKCWLDTRVHLYHRGPYEYDWSDLPHQKKPILKDFAYNVTVRD